MSTEATDIVMCVLVCLFMRLTDKQIKLKVQMEKTEEKRKKSKEKSNGASSPSVNFKKK